MFAAQPVLSSSSSALPSSSMKDHYQRQSMRSGLYSMKRGSNVHQRRRRRRRVDVQVDSKAGGNLFQGKKRSKAKLPGFVFYISPEDFTSTEADERLPEHIEAMVKKGTTMVVLHDPKSSLSTREFYNLAVNIKTNLRQRCSLFVVDRTDIVSSAEIDGVVLSTDGVPTVVARKSMPEGALVVVSAGDNAKNAEIAAKEGCDVLFVNDVSVATKIRDNVSVPIFSSFRDAAVLKSNMESIVTAGCDGVVLDENATKTDADIVDTIGATLSALGGDSGEDAKMKPVASGQKVVSSMNSTIPQTQFTSVIGEQGERLLNKERELLDDIVNFLETSASELEEIKLLLDARKGLDELFLIVIVGEFNAGKSSVINAVLGDKFLAEGILPTTNEITVLRYGESKRRVQSEDGFYNQDIPVDLLKQVSIVDTPGTNVILKRQQRLTEEFVPRADLVLFVLSADRPMTESEVKFLSYIKKWGKKVVFVLNKCDLLETEEDRNEVTKFVRDNAKRLLGVDNAPVIPVEARNALKLKKSNASMGEYAQTGFPAFEEYVNSYLGGGNGTNVGGLNRSGEALRLKLATPLNVSELLLSASKQILDAEMSVAETEVAAASGVEEQMNTYKETMVKDASEQVNFVRGNVNGAVKRANALVDETLRLENAVDLITTYIVGADYSELDDLDEGENSGEGGSDTSGAAGGGDGASIKKKKKKKYSKFVKAYQSTVLGTADQELKKTVKEFSRWLKRNNDARLSSYLKAVSSRGFDTTVTASEIRECLENSEKDAPKINSAAIAVADNFDNEAAAYKLDEEMRSAVYGSLGSSAGALVSAFVLSGFLSSMSEDILAYLLAAAVGYVGILSLPLKRQECKAKIQRAAEALVEDVERELLKELAEEIDATSDRVDRLVAPWEAAARVERARVESCLALQEKYATEVESLAVEVENL